MSRYVWPLLCLFLLLVAVSGCSKKSNATSDPAPPPINRSETVVPESSNVTPPVQPAVTPTPAVQPVTPAPTNTTPPADDRPLKDAPARDVPQ